MDEDLTPLADAASEILCPGCLSGVEFDQLLCHHCGCPQDFLSATVPFIRILSAGYIYRKAVESPQHWISVAGIWLLFGQLLGTGIAFLVYAWTMRNSQELIVTLFGIGIGAGSLLTGAAAMIRSARNFQRWAQAQRP